ncbi:hypothetical protein SAMN05421505_112112 [Sinosporangium album]|uniref:Uncharacterized protein n=2 Tax=Sinosporangium album TaxID=504805 RepID=A0A1G8ADP8_9ACTN|nr:hypothetical protein SAMN05421505_112112 [Sinosporangium album]
MEVRDRIGGALLYRLDTANGRITIGGTTGQITLSIPDTVTSAWTWRAGVYDLELVAPDARVVRLIEGTVTVRPEVTTGA